jgi:3-hydroxybutyryl-CoA dehydrogenase
MDRKVVIIGTGMMGPGIAACSVLAGHITTLVGRQTHKVETGLTQAKANIDQLCTNGLISSEQSSNAKELLLTSLSLQNSVKDAFFVVEAITENLDAKRELFGTLDDLTPKDILISSNTSGLRISQIAKRMKYPERAATTHFWFPGHLVPLVEIVMGERTSSETAETLRELLEKWGKTPVVVKRDLPGQLANRILQAVIREAVNIVQMGLATPEDVDTAIKAGMALRFPVWGPLEHIDGVGLDLALSVQKDVLPSLNNETQPAKYLEDLCNTGNLGYKTGKGIYDWSIKDMDQLANRRDTFIMETVQLLKKLQKKN